MAGVLQLPWLNRSLPHSDFSLDQCFQQGFSATLGFPQKLYKCYERQYTLSPLCTYVKRGSSIHCNASLGIRSAKKVENTGLDVS